MMLALCAIIIGDRPADAQRIKECQEIIKKRTSLFSSFRATSFLALAALLSSADDPSSKMDDVLDTYSIFKQYGFKPSDYLAISAFMIKGEDRLEKERRIAKAQEIYQQTKREQPLLTSSEDYGYAVMLAMTDMSPEAAALERGRCYDLLKGKFLSKDSVQTLSFILALGEAGAAVKCEKVMRLFEGFKQRGYKFGTGYELSGLGVLALAAKNEAEAIADVIEVSDFLKTKKGFGALGAGKTWRILYASMLVVQENRGNDDTLNTAMATTITNMLIAIQVMMVIIVATAASAAATPQSGH
jgi:hypothetical protein